MQCYVYKGSNKADHFLYLAEPLEAGCPVEQVPTALLEMLGELALVIDFDLDENRELPNADATQIIAALAERGFYFQMPKDTLYGDEERYFN